MNVRNERRGYSIFDRPKSFSRLKIRHGEADNLAPRVKKLLDLCDGGSNVPGVRVGHGLDGNGRISTNGNGSDMYFPGLSSCIQHVHQERADPPSRHRKPGPLGPVKVRRRRLNKWTGVSGSWSGEGVEKL
jgi:hypothetical protein